MDANLDLSLIIPAYNCAGHIDNFYACAKETLTKTGLKYQIIFVDDASKDATGEKLTGFKNNGFTQIIFLPKNIGQQAAIKKGIKIAQGRILIFMDDDQDFVFSYLPLIIEKIKSGADLVLLERSKRNITIFRRAGSFFMNLAVSLIAGKWIADFGGIKAFGNRAAGLIYDCGTPNALLKHLKKLNLCRIKIEDKSKGVSRYGPVKLLRSFFRIIFRLD